MGDGVDRRSRVARRWWAAPVVGLAVLAGCSSSATAVPDHVVVIGDSFAAIQQPALASVLHGQYTANYLIGNTERIGPIAASAGSHLDDHGAPAVVVVNLGTNDAIRGANVRSDEAPLQPLIDAVSDVPCVVLTTISLGADERSRTSVALVVNDQIKRVASTDPTRFKVVDWENFLATLPEASLDTYVRPDRIHPTPAGTRWLAQADLAGIRSCGTPAQPTVIGAMGR